MASSVELETLKIIVYSFSAVLISAVFAISIVGGIAFSKVKEGAGKTFGLLFSRSNFLRLSTVALCIFAVVILAVVGKLNDGSVAIISGIAGFVLGGVTKECTETTPT